MRPNRTGLGIVIMVAVGAAIAALTTLPFSVEWLLVVMGAFLALAPFLISFFSRLDIFEPVHLFALSFAVLFVVHPALDLTQPGGVPEFIGYAPRLTYAAALGIGVLGAIGFYIGYYSRPGGRLGNRLPVPPIQWSRSTLYAFTVAVTLLSVGLFGVFVATTGGASTLRALANGRNAASVAALHESSGYLYSAPLWLTPLAVLLLAGCRRLLSGEGLVGISLLVLSQVTALALGDRSWSVPAAASVVLVLYLRRLKRPRMVALVLGLVLLFVGISLTREYRNGTTVGQAFQAVIAHPDQEIAQFFGGPDTGMIDTLAIELQFVPQNLNYQFGNTYLEAIARPIPRSLWPAKPIEADNQLMKAIWPDFQAAGAGFAFSFFGEPYLNFGFIGVLLLAFVFGVLCRSLYAWFSRAPSNRAAIAIYALSWPFVFVYMRGGFGVDYQRQLIYVLPLLVGILLARSRSQHIQTPLPSKANLVRTLS